MKIIYLSFLLIFTLVSCQKANNHRNEEANNIDSAKAEISNYCDNELMGKTLLKIDTIDGKPVIDQRCGAGSPKIKFYKDSIYYYYPIEGSFYFINKSLNRNDKKTFDCYMLPHMEGEKKTIFEIEKIGDDLYKIDIDNLYSGLYIDSIVVGKIIKFYERSDCEDDTTNQENVTIDETDFSFNGTWKTKCTNRESSNILCYGAKGIDADLEIYDQDGSYFAKMSVEFNSEKQTLQFGAMSIMERKYVKILESKDYSSDIAIAQIKIIDNKTVSLNWLGFYNVKTNKREYTQNPFGKTNPIILVNCDK
jgi:hypothetical protein